MAWVVDNLAKHSADRLMIVFRRYRVGAVVPEVRVREGGDVVGRAHVRWHLEALVVRATQWGSGCSVSGERGRLRRGCTTVVVRGGEMSAQFYAARYAVGEGAHAGRGACLEAWNRRVIVTKSIREHRTGTRPLRVVIEAAVDRVQRCFARSSKAASASAGAIAHARPNRRRERFRPTATGTVMDREAGYLGVRGVTRAGVNTACEWVRPPSGGFQVARMVLKVRGLRASRNGGKRISGGMWWSEGKTTEGWADACWRHVVRFRKSPQRVDTQRSYHTTLWKSRRV